MHLYRFLFIAMFFLGMVKTTYAQVDSLQIDSSDYLEDDSRLAKPESEGRLKVGIKMGVQVCTLLGKEMPNSKLTLGLLGGVYGRYNFSKRFKNWSIQTEVQISFRGTNFTYTDTNYSALRLLYIDIPVIVFKALDSKKIHRIGIGAQFSPLLNTAMYLGKIIYPTTISPKLLPYDCSAILAYQYHLPFFAIQVAAKYGLVNLNINSVWPDAATPLNKNGTIRNFTVELNLVF